jgi:hypothetical protein
VAALGRQARRHVENHHDWDANLQRMAQLLEGIPPSRLDDFGSALSPTAEAETTNERC